MEALRKIFRGVSFLVACQPGEHVEGVHFVVQGEKGVAAGFGFGGGDGSLRGGGEGMDVEVGFKVYLVFFHQLEEAFLGRPVQ